MSAMNIVGRITDGMGLREKRTFTFHLLYSMLDGILLGVIALNEFVLLKSLGGSAVHVGIFFQMASFLMPLSIFLTYFLSRIKNKKRMLIIIAIITRGPLLLFLLFPRDVAGLESSKLYIYAFLGIYLLFYFASPILLPVINLFLKSNYRHGRFGRLYSYALSINQIMLFAFTLIFGALLDLDNDIYRYVYPMLGVLGFLGIYLLTKIPYKEPEQLPFSKRPFVEDLKNIYFHSIDILRTNPAYRDFQMGMMVYGAGFFFVLAILPVYLSKHFGLSYTEIAAYKDIPILISVMMFPFSGAQMDRLDPRRVAIRSFVYIMFYFACLMLALFFPNAYVFHQYRLIYFVLLGFIFNGIFSGSMTLLWAIGSSYFSSAGDAARYHAVHVSLTGVRGIIAPFLGVWIFYFGGYYASFSCSIACEALAVWLMVRSLRRRKLPELEQ